MAAKKVNGLEIENAATKNILFFCTIQKITFILLSLMLVATLFGITGYGLLGYDVVGSKGVDFGFHTIDFYVNRLQRNLLSM